MKESAHGDTVAVQVALILQSGAFKALQEKRAQQNLLLFVHITLFVMV